VTLSTAPGVGDLRRTTAVCVYLNPNWDIRMWGGPNVRDPLGSEKRRSEAQETKGGQRVGCVLNQLTGERGTKQELNKGKRKREDVQSTDSRSALKC